MRKLWQFRVYCLDLVRRWSGVSGPTRVSGPKDPDTPVHCFSLPSDLLVVRLWIGVRRYTGDGPESPVHRTRNLRSPVFPCSLPKCGAALDSSPEGHRKVSGISGPGRSLRCTYTGVSGLSCLQQLVFRGPIKGPLLPKISEGFSAE